VKRLDKLKIKKYEDYVSGIDKSIKREPKIPMMYFVLGRGKSMQQNRKSPRHAFTKVTREFIKIRPSVSRRETDDLSRTRQCGFRESRSYTAACSPWLWITSTTRQCEQNWKCQIRLLPRLYIYAHICTAPVICLLAYVHSVFIQGGRLNGAVSYVIIFQ